jgi:hypothetical protein
VRLLAAIALLLGLAAPAHAHRGHASLAVVEHWLLMLPLPVEKLFRWSLPGRRDAAKSRKSNTPRFDYTALKTNLTP